MNKENVWASRASWNSILPVFLSQPGYFFICLSLLVSLSPLFLALFCHHISLFCPSLLFSSLSISSLSISLSIYLPLYLSLFALFLSFYSILSIALFLPLSSHSLHYVSSLFILFSLSLSPSHSLLSLSLSVQIYQVYIPVTSSHRKQQLLWSLGRVFGWSPPPSLPPALSCRWRHEAGKWWNHEWSFMAILLWESRNMLIVLLFLRNGFS